MAWPGLTARYWGTTEGVWSEEARIWSVFEEEAGAGGLEGLADCPQEPLRMHSEHRGRSLR